VEREFGVSLPESELGGVTTLRDFVRLVNAQIPV
jgi:acyl carrier protein